MCGIIGISGGQRVIDDVYDGLNMLQHRGQDAAGIITFDENQFHSKRGPGLVRDVFRSGDMQRLRGSAGLGHCRYPTSGGFDVAEAQPFYVNSPFGLAMVHNGNLTNTDKLKSDLNKKNIRHLNTNSDSEMLLNAFAHELGKQEMKKIAPKKLFAAVSSTMKRISGGYAVIIIIAGQGMLAFRDPQGLRPMILAKQGKKYLFASESVAPVALEYKIIGDVQPGEAVFIPFGKTPIRQQILPTHWAPCLFEFIYLARPDSVIDKISVYKARLRAGDYLADDILDANLPIDVVVPVPDSGRTAALTIADKLKVPYREGLMKNRYSGRTFIMPDQATRKKSIKQKLVPLELELRNKNVLLVDDSIVRGNTSRQIIEMVRKCGAKQVYLASASPAVRYPDVYGIDMPTAGELIANKLSTEQIRKKIGADKLFYLELADLVAACGAGNPAITGFATHYFDGKYPTKEVTPAYLRKVEVARKARKIR